MSIQITQWQIDFNDQPRYLYGRFVGHEAGRATAEIRLLIDGADLEAFMDWAYGRGAQGMPARPALPGRPALPEPATAARLTDGVVDGVLEDE